jgi:hypothetical protein
MRTARSRTSGENLFRLLAWLNPLREKSLLKTRGGSLARYLEKRLVDGGGAHTRAFECFVPDSLLPQGQSHAGGGYREHVVPCALLRDKCMELLRSGIPVEQVAEWMRPYLAIVVITPDEANKMDSEMGLKTRMPSGWRFDEDCIFDRLHVAGIEFHPPPGHAVCYH